MSEQQPEIARLIKGDLNVITTSLIRGRQKTTGQGLLINVKAVQQVEDFFQALGTGEKLDISLFGRYWQPVSADPENALLLYDMQADGNPGLVISDDGTPFRVDRPGQAISYDGRNELPFQPGGSNGNQQVLNLSFLRLAGISSARGVSFLIQGLFGSEEVVRLRDRIALAQARFYRNYIKPMEAVAEVSISVYQTYPPPIVVDEKAA